MKRKISIFILAMMLVLALVVSVACDKKDNGLEDATAMIKNNYSKYEGMIQADFEVAPQIKIGDAIYTVEWSVNVTEGVTIDNADGKIIVNVNEESSTDIPFVLKAVISNEKGKTNEITFNCTVAAFKIATYNQYVAAEKGKALAIKGVVTGIISKSNGATTNGLYLQDENGAYYAYNLKEDPIANNVVVGVEVLIKGKKDIYSGTHEIVEGVLEIVNATPAVVAPADYTEVYTSAESLSASSLTDKQSLLVTVKGVTVGAKGDNGYYYFSIGEKQSYVRISSSTCPLSSADQKTFIDGHADHFGWTADVTGIVTLYNGAFYLTPVSANAFEYKGLPAKDDAGMVAFEKDALTLPAEILKDTVITLSAKGASYEQVAIAWDFKAETTHDCATIADGKLTIVSPKEKTEIVVVATLTSGTATETVEFTIKVAAKVLNSYIIEGITSAQAGEYVFGLYQAKLAKTLFVTGEVNSSEYLVTTEDVNLAAKIVVAAKDDGFTLQIKDGKYIEVYKNASNKVRIHLVDEPTAVWKWDDTSKLFTMTIEEKIYYLGTYNNYNTVSASETSYISGDNASKVGVSQFPAYLGKAYVAMKTIDGITSAQAGEYVFGLYQAKLAKTLFVTGEVNSSEYLVTTEDVNLAAKIVVAAKDDGFTLQIKDGKYIEIYKNASNKVRIHLVDEPTAVWKWDDTSKLFTMTVEEKIYYLGTYNSYNTVSASETSYISGDNASKVGVSQFPAYLGSIKISKAVIDNITSATAGEYNLVIAQNNKVAMYYVTGEVNSSEYLVTTEDASLAAKIVVAAKDDGFTLQIKDGKYIEIYKNASNKIRIHLVDEPTAVWKWDDTSKLFTMTVEEKIYYLGTYNNYNTVSASETSYITGDNASKVGISQFPAYFGVVVPSATLAPAQPAEPVEPEQPQPQVTDLSAATPAASLTFDAEKANRISQDGNSQVWAQNGITFTNEKAESTNNVADYANPVRCYKKSTVKIEYTGMTKIIMTLSSYADKQAGFDGMVIEGATIIRDGATLTIIFSAPVNVFQSTALASQTQIFSLEVYIAAQ